MHHAGYASEVPTSFDTDIRSTPPSQPSKANLNVRQSINKKVFQISTKFGVYVELDEWYTRSRRSEMCKRKWTISANMHTIKALTVNYDTPLIIIIIIIRHAPSVRSSACCQ